MKVALIAGAGGAASKRLIERRLRADPEWSVIGLARTPRKSTNGSAGSPRTVRPGRLPPRARRSDRGDARLLHRPRQARRDRRRERAGDNVAMLRNLIDAVEPVAVGLAHIHLGAGHEVLWHASRPVPHPGARGRLRSDFPNFYYDQQDLLAERARGTNVGVVGLAADLHLRFRAGARPQRRRGDRRLRGALPRAWRPVDFPGSAAAFDARRDLTDASLLARAMKFCAEEPACRNEAFNVTNGDVVSGARSGRALRAFSALRRVRCGRSVRTTGCATSSRAGTRIVAKHGLTAASLDGVADWAFCRLPLGAGLRRPSRARRRLHRAGFPETIDSGEMLLAHLQLSRRKDPAVITLGQPNAATSAPLWRRSAMSSSTRPGSRSTLWAARSFASVAALHDAMMQAVRAAPRAQQLAFLRGHPELAGKVARAGAMTADFKSGTRRAGLDRLSDTDFARFERANAAYATKFGFPFIVCVRLHKSAEIDPCGVRAARGQRR